MKTLSFKLWLIFSFYSTVLLAKSIEITQNDFLDGSLIISNPGTYIFQENLIFSPKYYPGTTLDFNDMEKPELFMFPSYQQRLNMHRSFNLGFFSALIIASDNVIIDLNGFTFKQSNIHGAMQRFFSLIELGNSPFPSKKGPANFTTDDNFISVSNVTIKNGILGSSSHHGIHGNDCQNVLLEDLTITDFSVAGVSLNDCDNLVIRNLLVEKSKKTEKYNSHLSQIIFTLQAYELFLKPNIDLELIPESLERELNQYSEELRDILRKLLLMEQNLEEQEEDHEQVSKEIYKLSPLIRTLTKGLPDGSLLAGILLHSSVNTGNFKSSFPNIENNEKIAQNVIIENVTIRELILSPIEFLGIKHKESGQPVKDMIGAALDIDSVRDLSSKDMNYVGNSLSNFQITLSKLKYLLLDNNLSKYLKSNLNQKEKDEIERLIRRDGISKNFIKWSENKLVWKDLIFSEDYIFFPNGDVMFHFMKGVFGIKIDQNYNIFINNTLIEKLINQGTSVSSRSNFYKNLKYSNHQDFNEYGQILEDRENFQFQGYFTRGLSFSGNVKAEGEVKVNELYSDHVLQNKAIDYLNYNSDISIKLIRDDHVCSSVAVDIDQYQGFYQKFEPLLIYVERDDELNRDEEDDEDEDNSKIKLTTLSLFSVLGVLVFIGVAGYLWKKKQEEKKIAVWDDEDNTNYERTL